ncbi:MAG: protein translocase subunit SecD [Alphaproteobacteria bacterium]
MVHFQRWQLVLVALACLLGVAFAAPNMLSKEDAEGLPGWLPGQQINLGLDLQGGSHLLLEVDLKTVLKEHVDSLADSIRRELRGARIRFAGLRAGGTSVVFRVRKIEDTDRARSLLLRTVGASTGGGLLGGGGREVEIETQSNGQVRVTLTETAITARTDQAVDQSIEVIRRRIDETGTLEPIIQRQGKDRILLQVPGLSDPERLKRLLGKTAKMTFHLTVGCATVPRETKPPPGARIVPSDSDPNIFHIVRKRIRVSGEDLIDAQATIGQQRGLPVVAFRFNSRGARRFGDVTRRNVDRCFAIVLDGKVISAPRILSPILGGSGIITGGFTIQTANDLALLLRAGALPAPLSVLEERTVGASLGADSISAGQIASLLGLVLVIVFMAIAYGRFGLMANIALTLNMVLLAGALSLLQATLTLPGIAGIVLTIGMAVDANVLIFERIREEVRSGRPPISAVDAGYRRALTTIVDSNLTTFIAALMLFFFGSGPVKGFAVTLSIGLATSMFSAIMITRFFVVWWLRRNRNKDLPI